MVLVTYLVYVIVRTQALLYLMFVDMSPDGFTYGMP